MTHDGRHDAGLGLAVIGLNIAAGLSFDQPDAAAPSINSIFWILMVAPGFAVALRRVWPISMLVFEAVLTAAAWSVGFPNFFLSGLILLYSAVVHGRRPVGLRAAIGTAVFLTLFTLLGVAVDDVPFYLVGLVGLRGAGAIALASPSRPRPPNGYSITIPKRPGVPCARSSSPRGTLSPRCAASSSPCGSRTPRQSSGSSRAQRAHAANRGVRQRSRPFGSPHPGWSGTDGNARTRRASRRNVLRRATRASQLRPDIVLMDIRMPIMDGVEATGLVTAPAPGHRGSANPSGSSDQPRVIILTTFDIDEYVFAALRNGASGFLLKDTPATDLIEAVRIVARGDSLLSPSVTRRLIEHYRADAPVLSEAANLGELTEREREVLIAMARGLSNAEIAAALFVSETTVKTHVSRVLTKLDLRDRVQAVVLAYECGLIRPGSV